MVYAEDYQDPAGPNFTADIRYLANIDPKLASSTLLDRLTVNNLEEFYEAVYRDSSSIRLCSWAPDKNGWVSLLGPKVDVQHKDKSILGNRPVPTTRRVDKILNAAQDFSSHGPIQGLSTASHVETWIERLQLDDHGSAGVASAVRHLVQDQAANAAESVDASDDLIDLDDQPLQQCHEIPVAVAAETVAEQTSLAPGVHHQITATSRALSTASQGEKSMPSENQAVKTPRNERGVKGLSFTGTDCLIDLLAAVRTTTPTTAPGPGICWEMPSLIPSPTAHGEDGPASVPDPDSESAQSRNSDGLLATAEFIHEIEAAMARVLEIGPYRRGRVAVRAELGRAILPQADATGIAFNNANTPSDGWKKSDLITRLNHGYGVNHHIHFTKVLSTYACDIEDMINSTDANGGRLWAQEPSRAWVSYTFHCDQRLKGDPRGFIVDIEDHGPSSGGVLVSSVRLQNKTFNADGSIPVYVHAIRHHWDMQIVTSHVNPEEIERGSDYFANTLLQSLSISYVVPHLHLPTAASLTLTTVCRYDGKGAPELKFAVRNSFAVEINDVRVLTKWRYPSFNGESALEITEVQQLEVIPYAEGVYAGSWDTWEGKLARPWCQRRIKESRAKGEFPRWYEAAVVSPELDNMYQQNLFLKVGEKAEWDVEDLKARGLLRSIYSPALQMLRTMDHVGRHDDNNLAGKYGPLLLRGNNPPPRVPGSSPVQEQRQGRSLVNRLASDGPRGHTASPQSCGASSRGSSAYRSPRAPAKHDQPGFW